ncbi:hypothetical protein M422DRAFT_245330 [Sphaerobolus stellatus SS14]|nr:hypothetical protein M422DRAFT_245330 [Sphaerobolus stellatus SS14]
MSPMALNLFDTYGLVEATPIGSHPTGITNASETLVDTIGDQWPCSPLKQYPSQTGIWIRQSLELTIARSSMAILSWVTQIYWDLTVDGRPDHFSYSVAASKALQTAEVSSTINVNGHYSMSSDTTMTSNNGTGAGRTTPKGTNIENVEGSSLISLVNSLPIKSGSNPNKFSHAILPFTPPEERKMGVYISTFVTAGEECSLAATGKDAADCPFGNTPKLMIMSTTISSAKATNAGANFSTDLTAHVSPREQNDNTIPVLLRNKY